MSKELEIRAQIDTENVKAILLINGGAAVALLAFLPSVLGNPSCSPLAHSILWALLIYQLGIFSAVVHNRLRRKCSMIYQAHAYRPPHGSIFGFKLNEPSVCCVSILFMWGSILAFIIGGALVFLGGMDVVGVCGTSSSVT